MYTLHTILGVFKNTEASNLLLKGSEITLYHIALSNKASHYDIIAQLSEAVKSGKHIMEL